MAGLGRKTFTAGEVLTAANVNGFLMDQSVMVFADAAARTTAIPSPTEGMVTYLSDTNALEFFNGASFAPVSNPGDITSVTAGTALTGGGTEGDVTLDVDISAINPITTEGDVIVGGTGGIFDRLAIGTTGQILQSDGTTLSYVTPDSSPDDIITTQGDLIIGDASANAARIGIGAADTVLTSDGTTATWEAAGGGGMDLISTHSLTGVEELQILGIDQSYTNLFFRARDFKNSISYQLKMKVFRGTTTAMNLSRLRLASNLSSPDNLNNNEITSRNSIGTNVPTSRTVGLLFNNYSDSGRSTFSGSMTYCIDGGSVVITEFLSGMVTDAFPITGFSFRTANTNWTGGTIEIWGIK